MRLRVRMNIALHAGGCSPFRPRKRPLAGSERLSQKGRLPPATIKSKTCYAFGHFPGRRRRPSLIHRSPGRDWSQARPPLVTTPSHGASPPKQGTTLVSSAVKEDVRHNFSSRCTRHWTCVALRHSSPSQLHVCRSHPKRSSATKIHESRPLFPAAPCQTLASHYHRLLVWHACCLRWRFARCGDSTNGCPAANSCAHTSDTVSLLHRWHRQRPFRYRSCLARQRR